MHEQEIDHDFDEPRGTRLMAPLGDRLLAF